MRYTFDGKRRELLPRPLNRTGEMGGLKDHDNLYRDREINGVGVLVLSYRVPREEHGRAKDEHWLGRSKKILFRDTRDDSVRREVLDRFELVVILIQTVPWGSPEDYPNSFVRGYIFEAGELFEGKGPWVDTGENLYRPTEVPSWPGGAGFPFVEAYIESRGGQS